MRGKVNAGYLDFECQKSSNVDRNKMKVEKIQFTLATICGLSK
jgi:hypothetical protein